MAFKNILSVVPVPGGFAVAVDGETTGQVYTTQPEAQKEVDKTKAERKAKREAEKAAKTTKKV